MPATSPGSWQPPRRLSKPNCSATCAGSQAGLRLLRCTACAALLKTVHRLVHKPTLELRAAAEADNGDLVSVLAGLFDATPSTTGRAADGIGLPASESDTTGRPCHPLLDVKR